MRALYLLVDLGTILVPFIFSFHPRIRFDRQFRHLAAASLVVAAIFVLWDIWFTRAGVWSFNPRYVTGVHVGNLPLEEVLFFFCIPFSCVFTYFCLTGFYRLDWPRTTAVSVAMGVAVGSLSMSVLFMDRMYTASSFLATAVTTLILQFGSSRPQFARTVTVYGVLLFPFFIVNGILTGTGPDAPVVIYNDAENLRIRMLTIPVEDIFYGFSLIGLNVYLFEAFSRRGAYSQLKLTP